MEYLQALFPGLSQILKENQMIAGAVSLWGLGVITWFSRNVPMRLYEFIKTNVITTITIENNDLNHQGDSQVLRMYAFLENHSSNRFIRNYRLDFYHFRHFVFGEKQRNSKGSITTLIPGTGKHIFFYNGRLFWANIGKETREQKNDRETISISTFSRNVAVFNDLIDSVAPTINEDTINLHTLYGTDWSQLCSIKKKPITTVVTHGGLLEKLIKDIEDFYSKKEWHEEKGIKHKLVIMLHGMPGTGKTSLIQVLASYFGKSIRQVNLENTSDDLLLRAMAHLDSDDFAVFEDIDSHEVLHSRGLTKNVKIISGDTSHNKMKEFKPLSRGDIIEPPKAHGSEFDFKSLTLSGVLNVFDGVLPLDGVVTFMTTNRLEVLDNALLRKRRVDKIYEVLPLEDIDVRRYLKIHFGDYEFGPEPFCTIAGCNLSSIVEDFYESPKDVEIALREFAQLETHDVV